METALPPPSLDKTFGNDIVHIDANLAGDKFLIVSRGGNQVLRAGLDPSSGQLNLLNAGKTGVDCRVQTGNHAERSSHEPGWNPRLCQQRGQFLGDVDER